MTDWNVKTQFGIDDYVWFRKNDEDRIARVVGIQHVQTIVDTMPSYTGYIVNAEEGLVCILKGFCFQSPEKLKEYYDGQKNTEDSY